DGRRKPVSLRVFGSGEAAHVAVGERIAAVPIPADAGAAAVATHLRKAIAQARASRTCDLVLTEGPAMPWGAAERAVLEAADAVVAVLPTRLDINASMEDVLDALGDEQHKLIGVVLNEVDPVGIDHGRGKQHA
ncbi:MAG: hypothetical protein WBA29_15665, partial [Xanthobacteraceae bacterium]